MRRLIIFFGALWMSSSLSISNLQASGFFQPIKIKGVTVEGSVGEPGEGVGLTIDGNRSTHFHSPYSQTEFPVKLTYRFPVKTTVDYVVIQGRSRGQNGDWGAFDMYTKSRKGKELKIGSYDFENKGGVRTLKMPIKNPEYIRFEVRSGEGDLVSCAEVEFFQQAHNDLAQNVFFDSSCSTLKPAVKKSAIDRIKNPMLKNIATQLYNQQHDSRLVVKVNALVDPVIISDKLRIGSGFSRYQNLTGVYLPAGRAIVFAKNIGNKNVNLLLPNWMRQPTAGFAPTKDPKGWGLECQTVSLIDGVNVIEVEKGTLAYIDYFDKHPANQPGLIIHFATGLYNGYFDALRQTDDEWNKLLDSAVAPIMDAVGRYVQVAYPISYFKQYAYGHGRELINNYDRMLLSHYQFMGLEKYNRMPQNKILSRVNFNYYMFRDKDGVAYLGDNATMRKVVDPNQVIKGDPCWGFSHEVGHVLQMRPQLMWGGLTEVSNNLYTLHTTTGLGNESRLKKEGVYAKARTRIIESLPRQSYLQDSDHFRRLVPFWQLHLFFSRNGKPQFYADLMEQFRNQPDAGKGNQSYKNMFVFIKACCDYGQLDLTDFFDKWGFFYVGDIELNDYAKYNYSITQQEVDEVKRYITSKNYPKPSIDLTTLED